MNLKINSPFYLCLHIYSIFFSSKFLGVVIWKISQIMLQKSVLIWGYFRSNLFYRIVIFWGWKDIWTSSVVTFMETVCANIVCPELLEAPLKLVGHLVSLWGGINNPCHQCNCVSSCQCHPLPLCSGPVTECMEILSLVYFCTLHCTPFALPTQILFFLSAYL